MLRRRYYRPALEPLEDRAAPTLAFSLAAPPTGGVVSNNPTVLFANLVAISVLVVQDPSLGPSVQGAAVSAFLQLLSLFPPPQVPGQAGAQTFLFSSAG